MALTSKITAYDPAWPQRYEAVNVLLASVFGDELLAIHHVGSTAVPQLAAKPEIDVLVEVLEHRNEAARDEVLLTLGYVRGSECPVGMTPLLPPQCWRDADPRSWRWVRWGLELFVMRFLAPARSSAARAAHRELRSLLRLLRANCS